LKTLAADDYLAIAMTEMAAVDRVAECLCGLRAIMICRAYLLDDPWADGAELRNHGFVLDALVRSTSVGMELMPAHH